MQCTALVPTIKIVANHLRLMPDVAYYKISVTKVRSTVDVDGLPFCLREGDAVTAYQHLRVMLRKKGKPTKPQQYKGTNSLNKVEMCLQKQEGSRHDTCTRGRLCTHCGLNL